MRHRVQIAAAMLILATGACVTRSVPEAQSVARGAGSSGAPEVDGREVYKQQYCGVCHELASVGSSGSSGPPHDGMGLIAARRIVDPGYTGLATTAREYLRESILSPVAYLVPRYEHTRYQMPAYTNLSESEVEALVRFLALEVAAPADLPE